MAHKNYTEKMILLQYQNYENTEKKENDTISEMRRKIQDSINDACVLLFLKEEHEEISKLRKLQTQLFF